MTERILLPGLLYLNLYKTMHHNLPSPHVHEEEEKVGEEGTERTGRNIVVVAGKRGDWKEAGRGVQ